MSPLRAAKKSSTITRSGGREGGRVFTVDLYRKVRLACSEGMSQREAARQFGISRDSVRKMLAFSVPPGYRRTAPVKRPKLDGFTEIIDGWLKGDREVHRKQRRTARRVFKRLRDEHGFTGGHRSATAGGSANVWPGLDPKSQRPHANGRIVVSLCRSPELARTPPRLSSLPLKIQTTSGSRVLSELGWG